MYCDCLTDWLTNNFPSRGLDKWLKTVNNIKTNDIANKEIVDLFFHTMFLCLIYTYCQALGTFLIQALNFHKLSLLNIN
jgi:hypothetical protein